MPRGSARVKTYYVRAVRKPRKKHPKRPPERPVAKGKTPYRLLRYIEQNSDSGLSRAELVQQFHEYDCNGKLVERVGLLACNSCDYWEKA